MASIKQVYCRSPTIVSKLTLCQRFQSLKKYIDIELRGIVVAYSGETEHVANEIASLAFYITDNLKHSDSSAVAQLALMLE